MARLRIIGFVVLALALFLVVAELTARLDDWLHQDTPLLANPNRERDLTVYDQHGLHGRPHGHFKKWKLNAFGFRSPEQMDKEPPEGVMRIMILGASETFGLREAEGKEYPAQLADHLHRDGVRDVEVVNGAMAGITIKSLAYYWKDWASQFRPQVVFIYPSPLFYLDEEPPTTERSPAPTDTAGLMSASRLAERLKDALRRNSLIRKVRQEWIVAAKLADKSGDWVFTSPPSERLQLYLDDMAVLLDAVQAQGARPVLLTHALSATTPPRPEDWESLREFRMIYPRATEETLVKFEEAANAGLRQLAAKKGVLLLDIAAQMDGHQEWFADLSHFNDVGAAEMARLLAKAIEDPQRGLRQPRTPTSGGR